MIPITRNKGLPRFTHMVNLKVLELLNKGLYANKIAEELKISPKSVHYHIQKLLDNGFLEQDVYSSAKFYIVTEKGKNTIKKKRFTIASQGMKKNKIRLHAMRISMPIVREEPQPDGFWEKFNNDFRNWIPKYKTIPVPIGFTINKTPKSIIVYIHSREISDPEEAKSIAWRSSLYMQSYMRNKGIILDVWRTKITNQHYAIPDKMAEKITKKGVYVEVNLGREAQHILPLDKGTEAKAWIDQSKGFPEVESNDLEYSAKYLKMPEMVAEIYNMQFLYAKNIKLHIKWVKKGIKLFERMESTLNKMEEKDKE